MTDSDLARLMRNLARFCSVVVHGYEDVALEMSKDV